MVHLYFPVVFFCGADDEVPETNQDNKIHGIMVSQSSYCL